MGQHAKLAPSAAHRWMQCPGAPRLEAAMPDVDTSYSREGTFAHTLAAELLKSGAAASTMLGRCSPVSDGVPAAEFICGEPMVEHLAGYLEVVRTLALLEEGHLQVEIPVHYSEDLWGTADAVILSGDGKRLHVVDLKYGAGKLVLAERNAQGLSYVISYMTEHMKAPDRQKLESVFVHIVQPRRGDSAAETHRVWEITRAELQQWFSKELVPAIEAATKPDAPLVPGDHCLFCKAAPTCPGLRSHAMMSAQMAFADAELTPASKVPDPAALSDQRLGDILGVADVIETWLNAVREHATKRLQAGHSVPGWKLVAGAGHRRWSSPAEVELMLRTAGVQPFEAPKLISPAAAEKALGKQLSAQLLAPLTTRPQTGPHLVPTSDPRPAASGAQMFLALPE